MAKNLTSNAVHNFRSNTRSRMASLALPLVLLLPFTSLGLAEPPAADRVFSSTAVALTPANFPHHTPKDVDDMFRLGTEVGNGAVIILQWSQPDLQNIAQTMVKRSMDSKLTPILAISPTKLEGMRGEYDVPEYVRTATRGKKLSFGEKFVYEAYIKDVLELAKLHPPYFCLATEINLLAFKDIQEYIRFAAIYKKVYELVKKVSPETKVFVSFQWDFFQLMDSKEPNKIAEHSKLIDIFRPKLDVLAFTSYPADHFPNPSAIPAKYYEQIYLHIKPTDPVMFM